MTKLKYTKELTSAIFMMALVFLFASPAKAQQDAQYSQYMFNGLVLNPAFAGSTPGSNVALFLRTQWVGFEDNPTSQSLSYHTPFYFDKAGVGLHIQNDRIGLERKTNVTGSLAYRIKSKSYTVSFGLQGGFQSYGIDQARLNTQDGNDQAFYPNVNTAFIPDVGFGLYYKSKKLYVGFSVPHMLETDINLNDYQSNLRLARLYRHYFITSAYRFDFGRNWAVIPSFLIKSDESSASPLSLDLTAHALYQDKVWFGLTHRFGDSYNFQIGTKLNNLSSEFNERINIGYAFDLTTSSFSAYNNGSHEIMMTYNFGGEETPAVRSPRFTY